MRSEFYYSYPKAIYDIGEVDATVLHDSSRSDDGIVTYYPDMERAIRENCHKLAKKLARITHHTEEEWRDTIVVILMSSLFPGFIDVDE